MSRRIAVIGAGAAGLAAAWGAKRAGRTVTVISAGTGATGLSNGAVDVRPWELVVRVFRALGEAPLARPLPRGVAELVADVDLWSVPDAGFVWIATTAGRVRPARGRDRALLDLGSLPKGRVLLPRAARAGWDADSLAAALRDEPWARAREMDFVAVDAPILRYDDERRIGDGDLAARHDDDGRIAWLASQLREALARHAGAAVLLGPWLGASRPRAEALVARTGAPAGEAVAGAGSPAGLRFEAARDRALAALAVETIVERVVKLERNGGISVTLARGATRTFDGVVIATGGVAGGGVVYTPPEHRAADDLPPRASLPFALSFEADLPLAVVPGVPYDTELDVTSSLHGPEIDTTAWPSESELGALEAAGLRCNGVAVDTSVTAAGDAMAGRPRTIIEALASGLRAGREA